MAAAKSRGGAFVARRKRAKVSTSSPSLLRTCDLFQSFIGNRLNIAIAKNVERRAEASKEFPLRHVRHWNAWQRSAVDERASRSIHEDAMAVDMSGAQFGDL